MADEAWIVSSPEVLGGKAHVRGTRLSVEFLLELMAQGATREQILSEYDQLTAEGLTAALRYAAGAVKNDVTWDVSISA
jgi:uncharacterized protein (DUF433 family)